MTDRPKADTSQCKNRQPGRQVHQWIRLVLRKIRAATHQKSVRLVYTRSAAALIGARVTSFANITG